MTESTASEADDLLEAMDVSTLTAAFFWLYFLCATQVAEGGRFEADEAACVRKQTNWRLWVI